MFRLRPRRGPLHVHARRRVGAPAPSHGSSRRGGFGRDVRGSRRSTRRRRRAVGRGVRVGRRRRRTVRTGPRRRRTRHALAHSARVYPPTTRRRCRTRERRRDERRGETERPAGPRREMERPRGALRRRSVGFEGRRRSHARVGRRMARRRVRRSRVVTRSGAGALSAGHFRGVRRVSRRRRRRGRRGVDVGRGRVRSVGTRRRRETSVDADAATRRGIVRPESAVGILRSVAHGGGGARLERRVCRIRPGGMFVDVGRRGWRETRPRRRRGVRGHADDGRADARGCGGFQKRVVRAVAHAGARRGRGGVGVRIGREGERRGVDDADARGVSRANSPPGERRRARGGDGGERRGAVHVGCRSKRRARTRRDGGRIRAETRATTRRSRRLPRDVRPGIHRRRGIPENHDATRKGGVGKGADAIQIGAGEVGGVGKAASEP